MGSIFTTVDQNNPTINARSILLKAPNGDIGSAINPLNLASPTFLLNYDAPDAISTTEAQRYPIALATNATNGGGVHIYHNNSLLLLNIQSNIYGTPSILSLTQGNGDILIGNVISRPDTDITITALNGGIRTFIPISTHTISARSITLNASGDIGSHQSHLLLSTTTSSSTTNPGPITINPGPNGVFLAHAFDVTQFGIHSFTNSRRVSLIQRSGDIVLTSSFNQPNTELLLEAQLGSIFTTVDRTNPTINARSILLRAVNGDIGSPTNPFNLVSTTLGLNHDVTDTSFTTEAQRYPIALFTNGEAHFYHNDSIALLRSISNIYGTLTALSLTQDRGDILLLTPIIRFNADVTVTALSGGIRTFVPRSFSTISARSITLNASGDIGSHQSHLLLSTPPSSSSASSVFNINAGSNAVFFVHNYDISQFDIHSFTNSRRVSLIQRSGDIVLTSSFNQPNTELLLESELGSILTTVDSSVTTISARSILLRAVNGDIGSPTNPLNLVSTRVEQHLNVPDTITNTEDQRYPIATLTNGGGIYLYHNNSIASLREKTNHYGAISSFHLTQGNGDIQLFTPITQNRFTDEDISFEVTLTALNGGIQTSVPLTTRVITATAITLNATGDIGSLSNPLNLATLADHPSFSINNATNGVFLAHTFDIFSYNIQSFSQNNIVSLTQVRGDIVITQPVSLPSSQLTLTALSGNIRTIIENSESIHAQSIHLSSSQDIGFSFMEIIVNSQTVVAQPGFGFSRFC